MTENLYLRGGFYWIRYNVNGRKVRRSLGTTSLREAQRLKAEILGHRAAGDTIRAKFGLAAAPTAGAPVLTFAELAKEWLAARQLKWRARSRKTMNEKLNAHLLPFFGPKRIGDISRADVRAFLRHMSQKKNNRGQPLSRDSLAAAFRCLRRIYKFAYHEELYAGPNPTDLPLEERPTPKPKGRQVFLTEEELGRLLAALAQGTKKHERRLYVMTVTAAYVGLRWGEANGLRWTDLDLDGAKPTIRIEKTDDGEAKTEGSKALRALHPALVRVLRQWRDANPKRGELVFPGHRGGLRTQAASEDRYPLQDAAKVAGISKHLTPHVLRHTYGTLTYQNTLDIEATRRLLRHSSINTTMRYIHDVRDLGEHVAALPDLIPAPQLKAVP